MELVLASVLGFAAGYLLRDIISRRRHLRARQRRRMGVDG
jgi:hypothetical protein